MTHFSTKVIPWFFLVFLLNSQHGYAGNPFPNGNGGYLSWPLNAIPVPYWVNMHLPGYSEDVQIKTSKLAAESWSNTAKFSYQYKGVNSDTNYNSPNTTNTIMSISDGAPTILPGGEATLVVTFDLGENDAANGRTIPVKVTSASGSVFNFNVVTGSKL